MTTLIVAAHPDDEVLGCGGTICRLAEEGEEVHVVILGEGITSRFAARKDASRERVSRLRETASDVARYLGVRDLTLHELPDNRFDTVPLLDVIKILEAHISRLEPRTVFVQHGGDLNVDHQVTYRATLTATRPLPRQPVKDLFSFEVASSTEWAFGRFAPGFQPSYFVDIGPYLERKVEAMGIYDGEIREFPHPRSAQAIRATATRCGSTVGVAAAEVFDVVRMIT
jgi:LmbE family N-acetylglucosaminyl deacetylase